MKRVYVCGYFICMHICLQRPEESVGSQRQLYISRWVLGIETASLGRVT